MLQKIVIVTVMIVASIAVMGMTSDEDDPYSPQVLIKKSAKVFEEVAEIFE